MLAVGTLVLPAPLLAGGGVDGLFVTVQSITSKEKDRIKTITGQAIARFKEENGGRPKEARRTFKLVLDFNPDGQANIATDFGVCSDLADFLLDLDQDIVSIAFVHGEVSEHSVLPVLAARVLVMSSERSALGEVKVKNDWQRQFYLRVLHQRHREAEAAAIRMFDPEVRVRRVYRLPENTPLWIDARTVPEGAHDIVDARIDDKEAKVRIDPKASAIEDPALAGTSSFGAERARKYGLCQRIEDTREDVAWAFEMPPTSLRGDPLLGRAPHAWRIDIEGQITRSRVQSFERQIRHALGKESYLLIIQLKDCNGGEFQPALDFAHELQELKGEDGKPITTVAYIPDNAPDAATIVALGCSMIMMRQGATIGDFRNRNFVEPNPANNEQRIQALKELARKQGYADALIEGMMNPDVRLVKVEDRSALQHEWRVLTEADWKKNEERWKLVEEVKPRGELLILSADRAHDLKLAQDVVKADTNDLGPLYNLLALDPDKVESSKRDWLDHVADFLCSWYVSVLLVMIGVVCLILELKLPGATLPIIIAAVCFILFFWAHSQLSGQFLILALLLFVLGLVLLGVEVFVLPGFGVTGISGILLVLLSLALVTLHHKPESPTDWLDFGRSMTIFGAAILAAGGIALGLAANLHHIPYLNRLVLRPEGESDEDPEIEPALGWHRAELAELLGAIGVAATPLRPAGKVQFGEEFVDVVAESGYVAPGSRVQVVEIEGNRIVVKEV
jgi:membrane-bound ClpP family serine protease